MNTIINTVIDNRLKTDALQFTQVECPLVSRKRQRSRPASNENRRFAVHPHCDGRKDKNKEHTHDNEQR